MMILIISEHSLSINSTIIHALLCKIRWPSQYIICIFQYKSADCFTAALCARREELWSVLRAPWLCGSPGTCPRGREALLLRTPPSECPPPPRAREQTLRSELGAQKERRL